MFDLKKFFLAGIAGGIVLYAASAIFVTIVRYFFPYDILGLPGMRSVNDPLMLLFFLYPFVLSFAMAGAYQAITPALQGKWFDKGKTFGVLMWVVTGIPNAFLVYSSMEYPLGFTIESFAGSLVYMIAAGITIARIQQG